MKKWIAVSALLILGGLLAAGCSKKETYDMQIYYLNSDETDLKPEGYNLKSGKAEEQVQEVLKKMQKPKDSVECIPAIPTDVMITDVRLEDNRLDLYFSEDYDILDAASDVLLQAAVVQTVTQIDGVDCVQFHVADDVLKDHDGNEVGYLYKEDFVQDTGKVLKSRNQRTKEKD